MTNEEIVLEQIRFQKRNAEDCVIDWNVLDYLENMVEENTKLKAEIEQLKSTISEMETTTAQEDDLKQCYSCEFATKQPRKRIKGKVVRVTDKN